jgi:AcrR family transcriptional regulator
MFARHEHRSSWKRQARRHHRSRNHRVPHARIRRRPGRRNCPRAKVSKRTLYPYFPSTEELFDEIVRVALTQHPADENGVYDARRLVEDQLRELIDGYLTVITAEQYIALARVVTAAFIRNPELARAVEHNAPEDGLERFFSAAMADDCTESHARERLPNVAPQYLPQRGE